MPSLTPRWSFGLLLRFFGYAKVPPKAVELAARARMTWEREPAISSGNSGITLYSVHWQGVESPHLQRA